MAARQRQEAILYQNDFWLRGTYAEFSPISRPQQRWHVPRLRHTFGMDSAHWGSRERTLSELRPKPRRPAWKNRYLLANHVSRILVNEAGRSVAPETLVHFAFVSLKPGGTHALHVSAAGQRAGLGGHAVVMADVCSGRSGEQVRNQEHFTVSRSGWISTGFLIQLNYPHQMTS